MVNKALLIGINYLTSSKYRLSSPINDVNIIKDFLINYLNYNEEDIIILSDSPKEKESASFFNIVKHLKLLATEMTSQDFLFMYFSGHGGSVVDINGDETDRKDEMFLPQDWQVSYISDDLFKSLLLDYKCKLFIMFDCCNSGTICDLKFSYNIKDNTLMNYLKKVDDDVPDIVCVSSSGENKNSFEKYINKNLINTDVNKFYGEFTIFFVHILKYYLEENLSFENFIYNDLIKLMNYYVNPLPDGDFSVSEKLLHQSIYSTNLKPFVSLSYQELKDEKFFSSNSSESLSRFKEEGAINGLKKKNQSSLSHKVLRQHRKIDFLEKINKKLVEKNNKLLTIINQRAMINNFGMVIS